MQELKQELGKKKLILTAALGAAINTIDSAYDIPEISKYLDLLHFMCYDYHGPWDKTVGANAPLTSNDRLDLVCNSPLIFSSFSNFYYQCFSLNSLTK